MELVKSKIIVATFRDSQTSTFIQVTERRKRKGCVTRCDLQSSFHGNPPEDFKGLSKEMAMQLFRGGLKAYIKSLEG